MNHRMSLSCHTISDFAINGQNNVYCQFDSFKVLILHLYLFPHPDKRKKTDFKQATGPVHNNKMYASVSRQCDSHLEA